MKIPVVFIKKTLNYQYLADLRALLVHRSADLIYFCYETTS